MLKLTGEYQHVVDGKSRVLISNKLRSQIDVDEHGCNFYLVLGANGILCLYPEKYFERITFARDLIILIHTIGYLFRQPPVW